jgi:hypothetical protein
LSSKALFITGHIVLNRLKEQIREFLLEFKDIAVNRRIDIVNRLENMNSMAELGLTKRNCIDEILTLSVEDYCTGPDADKDRPGEVWIFGKRIGSADVYIKLKIAVVENIKIAKCISFHEARFPLTYPCRQQEGSE